MSHEWSGWLAHRKWALVPALLENVRSGAHATTHAISYVGLKSRSFDAAGELTHSCKIGWLEWHQNRDKKEKSPPQKEGEAEVAKNQEVPAMMRRGRREVAGGPWERVVADRSADPALQPRDPAAPTAPKKAVP